MKTGPDLQTIQNFAWLKVFFTSLTRAYLSPVTLRGYRYNLHGFTEWYASQHEKPLKLAALTPQDVIRYRTHLVEKVRLKPASVNRRLDALRRLCQWGLKEGHLKAEIPVELVYRPRERKVVKLAPAQIQALLRAAGRSSPFATRRNYALIQLLLHTGLRIAEVAALQVDDVILRERQGWIDVRAARGTAPRRIPLPAPARRALSEYLAPRGMMHQQEPLFCSKRRGAMSLSALHALVATVGQRAKLSVPGFSAQMLRHTFAFNYLAVNPGKYVELAQLLGHVSVASTKVYRHDLSQPVASPCPSQSKFSGR